jgi:hypothetical protein
MTYKTEQETITEMFREQMLNTEASEYSRITTHGIIFTMLNTEASEYIRITAQIITCHIESYAPTYRRCKCRSIVSKIGVLVKSNPENLRLRSDQ